MKRTYTLGEEWHIRASGEGRLEGAIVIATVLTCLVAFIFAGVLARPAIAEPTLDERFATVREAIFSYPEPSVEDHLNPEPEPEPVKEAADAVYYEEPVYYGYSGGNDYGNSFKSEGVRYENGTTYTWYSQNVLPGGGLDELNSNGRHVGDDGFIRDGDGYLAVASSDHEIGAVIDTPWGEAKVYDGGCDSGTIDMYTDF